MNNEIKGILIFKDETLQVSDKFRKRDFVLEISENINGREFTEFIKFQVTQDWCDVLDSFNLSDIVKVQFNIRGKKYEKDGKTNYFTNLEAWKIECVSASQNGVAKENGQQANAVTPTTENETTDDLPF